MTSAVRGEVGLGGCMNLVPESKMQAGGRLKVAKPLRTIVMDGCLGDFMKGNSAKQEWNAQS